MIAGEDAEAARIDRQAFGEAVLGGEIGDQLAVGRRGALAHARIVDGTGGTIERQVARVGGRPLQGGLRDAAQHQDRIVAALPPDDGIEAAEHGADDRLPTPDDVVGQFGQTGQRVGQTGTYQKFTEWLNVKRHTRVELTLTIADWPL